MGAAQHPLGALAPLAEYRQFVVAMLAPKANGKMDKIPVDHTSGFPVDHQNPQYWTDYETAAGTAAAWGSTFGIGFVLTAADPFAVIDLDSCRAPTGPNGWSALANEIVGKLPGAVAEVSQSQQGLHVWARHPAPPPHRKVVYRHDVKLEAYHEKRFMFLGSRANGVMAERCDALPGVLAEYFPPHEAAGGNVPEEGPRSDWNGPTDDDELLRRALMSRSKRNIFSGEGATFADLWRADAEVLGKAYPPDQNSSEPYDRSSADMALASHLAFWCGANVARVERLMRRSALARSKWDDRRDDYLIEYTIKGACAMQREVLRDKPLEPLNAPATPPVDAPAGAAAGPPPPPGEAGAPQAASPPEMRLVEGTTFATPAQQVEFFRGCVYVVEQHRVLTPGHGLLRPEQFRARFGGYNFAMDNRNEKFSRNAWEAFTESQATRPPMANGVCFKPQQPFGAFIETEGRRRVNTYEPTVGNRVAGDVLPFLRHLELVLPVKEDRDILLYWMANVAQRPGVKSQWMPLLVGAEGNGKTSISQCLAHAVGKRYTHGPRADQLGAKFNGWLFGKLLICIEDLKIETMDVWEALKPMITGEDLAIESKGIDQRAEEVCANFIANSNHKDAVKVTVNDRRVCHLWTKQQSAEDVAADGMDAAYMARLHGYLKSGGKAHVAEYLHTLVIPPEFGLTWFTGRAPRTSSTAEAIDAARSVPEEEVLNAIEEGRTGFRGGWISSYFLTLLLNSIKGVRVSRTERLDLLKRLGYERHPGLANSRGQTTNEVLPDNGKPVLYVKKDHGSIRNLKSPAEISAAYTKAQVSS